MSNVTIGIYYELPNGQIAYTYGWTGKTRKVMYHLDGDKGRSVTYEEFCTWTPRRDLKDFPNASDPRLPYVFDLLWDIKFTSQLRNELQNHPEQHKIRKLMEEHNIKDPLEERNESLKQIVEECEKEMQCNCDLDNWQPENSTGHSWVCRIHKAAMRKV